MTPEQWMDMMLELQNINKSINDLTKELRILNQPKQDIKPIKKRTRKKVVKKGDSDADTETKKG